jgi:hypothetical protein
MPTIVEPRSLLLADLINNRRFDVPEIQRAYAFAIDNSDDAEADSAGATFLKQDLWSFHTNVENTQRNYFLGSIIVKSETGLDDEEAIYELLDGQQRITTLSLLMNELYRKLEQFDDYEEIANEIYYSWLVFDDSIFQQPEHGWEYCLYPRRATDRAAYLSAMQGNDLEYFAEGNIRDVVQDFRNFVDNMDADTAGSFAATLLTRVEIMLLCVPNTAMAFQMFQTANARGTPLSQLDMFRSTVVMQALTVLNLNRAALDQLLGFLRQIEEMFIRKYENEVTRGKKIDQLMKNWLCIRRGMDAGGVSYIMRMVEECANENDLYRLVFDLWLHVETWCDDVEVTFATFPNVFPLNPLFPRIPQGWKLFYLAVKTASKYPRAEHGLSELQERKLLDLMNWWYIIRYCHDAENSFQAFRDAWAQVAHRTWHHTVTCNIPFDGWDDDSFDQEFNEKIGDFEFVAFPTLPPNSFEINHARAATATSVLAQFERRGIAGLGALRLGRGPKDANLIHIVPSGYIPEDLYHSIGNRTLIYGYNRGGSTVRDLQSESIQWADPVQRLNGLIGRMSLLSRTESWPLLLNHPHHLSVFIRHRNEQILKVLNQDLDQFRDVEFEF